MKVILEHNKVKHDQVQMIRQQAERFKINSEPFDVAKLFEDMDGSAEVEDFPPEMEALSSKESSSDELGYEKIGSAHMKKYSDSL